MQDLLGTLVMAITGAVLVTGVAQSMEIQQFDRMAVQDQSDYINLLVVGAQRVLIDEGKHELAALRHSKLR